jgi:hypothetical protein
LSHIARAVAFLVAVAASLFLAFNVYFGFGIGGCDLPPDGHSVSRFLCSYVGFFFVMATLGLLPAWALVLLKLIRHQQSPRKMR